MIKDQDLLKEIERLQLENETLKKKLGVPADSFSTDLQDGFLPTTQNEKLPSLDSQSSTEEKIRLFRMLFRGREDVYAIFWMNEQTGKKGYSPACEDPWVGRRGGQKKYLPLTDDVIRDHLLGGKTIGVYSLLMNNTCLFLVCDFDKEGWVLDATAYQNICGQNGIPAYLERSRSGNGGHVWIFFSMPVRATDARQLGMRLLRETMVVRAELDLGSYDRFFPNQDFVPRGGFGNLIALPLQKKCRALGNTEFINGSDSQLSRYVDQWFFLSQVQRVSPLQLEALLEKIPPIMVGHSTPKRSVSASTREKYPAPEQIRCSLRSRFSIEKSGIPPWMLSQIKHLASLPNPEFFKRQNLRLSTYGVPVFVKCYEEDMSHLHLPRGLCDEIKEIFVSAGSRLILEDHRPTTKKLALKFLGLLTPEQEEAIQKVLSYPMGVLVAPPGMGKTVMGCYAVAKRNMPTLILAHRKPILDQWRQQLTKLLGLTDDSIGQIGGGKNRSTEIVDLAMIQSLKRFDDLEEFFSKYGFIVVDECHHIPALTFETTIKQAPSRYILGLTATIERRDKLHGIIAMQCGPVRTKMVSTQTNKTLTLINRETSFIFQGDEKTSIQDTFRDLVQDDERNELIVTDVCEALSKGRRCLVLSHWKEHCDQLIEKLTRKGKTPFLLVGTLGKKQRTAVMEEIQTASHNQGLVIVATGQYLGEGFDCPQIDTLFMAFPISFKGKLIQYVGRIMRDYPGKTSVMVHDYVDSQVPILKRMHARRLRTYKSMQFDWSESQESLLF